MKKEYIQSALAKIFAQVRIKRGLSKSKIADSVYISEATWARYENGESAPTVPEMIRIFSELNEDSLKYVLKLVYPETYGDLTYESPTKDLRKAAAHYFTEVASDQTVRIWDFITFGSHGSNVEAQMQEFCAYEHLPLDYKLAVACLIDSLYNLAMERGELIEADHVRPNLEVFRSGLRKGKEAAYRRTNSYTTATE